MPAVPLHNVHVIIFNRWRDKYADYLAYLDHDSCKVTYVTTEIGRSAVPDEAAEILVLDDVTDYDAVRAAIDPAVTRHGTPEAVIALQEGDLAVASRLRAEFGSRGRRPEELHHFLDKEAMLEAARRTGVATPISELVVSHGELENFAAENGWPIIVKRLQGRASTGIQRLDGPADIAGLTIDAADPVVVQEYLPHRVCHVDGIHTGQDLGPWRLSAYENVPDSATTGPLAFMMGEPVGSVEIDDAAANAAVEKFLRVVIPGMSSKPWVFHLELFLSKAADGYDCVFLEVGCRPGGGDIPFVWREVHGIDLMELEFHLQCDVLPRLRPFQADEPVGGCLLVPLSGPRPCRIAAANSMVGIPGPYAEVLPEVGSVVPDLRGTYEFIGGRFRYRGESTAEVTRQILGTAADYEVRLEPVEEAAPVASNSQVASASPVGS
ncbi:biotin carboxylase [Streptomyces sp. NPDC002668]|uniref:ATP-grasp domain-containing protein n=1 Tax=Streptomyces sp. NPDC002668 TaxID=3154422 RepID=UPI003327299E